MPRLSRKPKERSLDLDYARWLFNHSSPRTGKPIPLVERWDWGWRDDAGKITRTTTEYLEAFYFGDAATRPRAPRRLTRPRVAARLAGSESVYTVSNCASGFAFPMIDADGHEGQRDFRQAIEFVRENWFPGAYDEGSGRGHHLHPIFRIGRTNPGEFNRLLARLKDDLRALLLAEGFEATLDVTGTFTLTDCKASKILSRGLLAALPRLPGGRADFDRLKGSPIFSPADFGAVNRAAEEIRTAGSVKPLKTKDKRQKGTEVKPGFAHNEDAFVPLVVRRSKRAGTPAASSDAFMRMHRACSDFFCLYRRLPGDVDELVRHYGVLFDAGPVTRDRLRRAKDVLRFRAENFDPATAEVAEGYIDARDGLLAAVRLLCVDRSNPRGRTPGDEELAAYLHLIGVSSFTRREDPAVQWTVPNNAAAAFFGWVRESGIADVSCGLYDPEKELWHANRDAVAAYKHVLSRARLIECIDSGYVFTKNRTGIGRKYTVGPAHHQWREFLWFSEDVRYDRALDAGRTVGVAKPPVPAAAVPSMKSEVDWEDVAEVGLAELLGIE